MPFLFLQKNQEIVFRIPLFLLLSLSLISHRSYCQASYQVAVIGFYNVENFFDTLDNPEKLDEDFLPNGPYHNNTQVYTQKLHNIAHVIKEMGTDVSPDGPAIMGMAELENDNVLRDLVAQPDISSRHYKYLWFPTPDERGISTAMIYNPRYYTVLDAHPVRVALETIGMKRPTRDILYSCGLLPGGDTIHVLVNHWPSKSGGEAASAPGRDLAAATCRRIIDSLQQLNPNVKVVVMGDLNDDPACHAVTEVLKTTGNKTKLKDGVLYNPWIKLHDKGLGTENYRGEWHLIDQIIMSDGIVDNNQDQWKFYSALIFNKEFLTHRFGREKGLPHRSYTISSVWDNGYSDHFPVLVYLIKKSKTN